MKLIDRYVYAVTERLAEDNREDVSKELHANIEDMLPNDATESDVRIVLEKLGSPIKLANEYRDNKRYLIGPELYDNYISVLKIVVSILAVVLAGIALFEGFVTNPVKGELLGNSIGILVNVITYSIQGMIQGFLWVTLVFVILERVGIKEGKISGLNKRWTIDDLPVSPVISKRKISLFETVFSMISIVTFTALIYFKPEFIALYIKREGSTIITPLFDGERLQFYLVVILLIAMFSFSIAIWKFIFRQWSMPLATANTVNNIAICILMYLMVSDNSLFNQDFVSNITELFKTSNSHISSWLLKTKVVFVASFIIINLWDSVNGIIKSKI